MAKSLTEQLDAKRSLTAGGARQKKPSGHGKGIWNDNASLEKYRKARNKKRKDAKRRGR